MPMLVKKELKFMYSLNIILRLRYLIRKVEFIFSLMMFACSLARIPANARQMNVGKTLEFLVKFSLFSTVTYGRDQFTKESEQ